MPLPTGTVTFLFTDIEGSTRQLTALGERYPEVLEIHTDIVRRAISGHIGCEVEREGDSFFAVFPSAVEAVRAAADSQRELATAAWPGEPLRVRMGLHTGEGRRGGTGYIGLDVYRAARISAAGHGGQVLLSDATRAVVAQSLPEGVTLRDLGLHRLKDIPEPERIWQLDIAGLDADFPAIRAADSRPNNLPVAASPLIGRGRELADVTRLLGERRLVTLTGPGGTGKTRLALASAERLLGDFRDGVFFVPLDEVRDRGGVAAAIGAALDIRERRDQDPEAGLESHLAQRQILLVLDNFEQVTPAGPMLTELLARVSGLRLLVTSRAVLHLSGEQAYEVPPLSLPDVRQLPPLAALADYEAVALFVERAAAVQPDFTLTNVNAATVAEICGRLDGLPLAIELAAARVRLFSPQAILDRLERRLPLLTGGAQDRPDRQRTLADAIAWSYELLDAPRRRFFRRLSTFAGGWTLEAAEVVANPGGELGLETLDGVATLIDDSLAHATRVSEAGGEPRYEMLQVIREFGSDRLAEDADADALRERHAGYYLALAEAAEPHLVRSDLRPWQDRLRAEEENLRTALRWAVDRGRTELGLRLAGNLWRFWQYWGEFREGSRWLESVLALPGAAGPTEARALALSGLAGVRFWQGDVGAATALYEEALPIYRAVGSDRQIADALQNTAWAALVRGDLAVARTRAEEALGHFRRADDRAGLALVTAWLRTGEYLTGLGGDADTALAAAREAVAVFRETDHAFDLGDWLGTLALVYERTGDHARAWETFREAVAVNRDIRNVGALPWLKFGAKLELARGHPDRAAQLAAAAERSIEEAGGELPGAITGVSDPLAEARAFLSPEAFDAAVAAGRAMTTDEAIAFALADA